jgi:hypothetical protein
MKMTMRTRLWCASREVVVRDDMPKVLVERPRTGWRIRHGLRRRAWERAVRCRFGDDGLPSRMPIGFAATKGLNENLAPLKRFLVSRVGRSWDGVYSEIRAKLAPRNAIDMHIWQHLFDFILFARPSRDGGLELVRRNGLLWGRIAPNGRRFLPRGWGRHGWLLVGQDGVLRHPPQRRRERRKEAMR